MHDEIMSGLPTSGDGYRPLEVRLTGFKVASAAGSSATPSRSTWRRWWEMPRWSRSPGANGRCKTTPMDHFGSVMLIRRFNVRDLCGRSFSNGDRRKGSSDPEPRTWMTASRSADTTREPALPTRCCPSTSPVPNDRNAAVAVLDVCTLTGGSVVACGHSTEGVWHTRDHKAWPRQARNPPGLPP